MRLCLFAIWILLNPIDTNSAYFVNSTFEIEDFPSDQELFGAYDDPVHELFERQRFLDNDSMRSLSVTFKISDPGTEDIAGGVLDLANGTRVYLDRSGVGLVFDLRDSLNLNLTIGIGDWNFAWFAVDNGSYDLGGNVRSADMHELGPNGSLGSTYLLHPILAQDTIIYYKQPVIRLYKNIITRPLKKAAWYILLLCWLILIFACSSIHLYYSGITISEPISWGSAIICGRYYPIWNPDKLPFSIAVFSCMLLNLLISIFYGSKILALYSTAGDVIQKPSDLLAYNYTFAAWTDRHFSPFFDYESLNDRPQSVQMAVTNFYKNQKKTFPMLLGLEDPNFRYALITAPDGLYYIEPGYQLKYNPLLLCELDKFVSFRKSLHAMYLHKSSPLKNIINWKLLQLMERGLNSRYQKKHRRGYDYYCTFTKKGYEEIGLRRTSSIFRLLIYGAVAAVSVEVIALILCHRIPRHDNEGI